MTKRASAFRSIRFGISEAHGRGIVIQLNTLFDTDAVLVGRDGTLRVNRDKVKDAVDALTRELLTIQAAGDPDEGEGTARQAGCCLTRGGAGTRPAEGHTGRHRAEVHHRPHVLARHWPLVQYAV